MPILEGETSASASAGQSERKSANCHSRNRNHFHSLTSSPIGTDTSQHFHNANDCSNNGQIVMGTTTTGYSNINNNGNPNATASNNSITCDSDHNSSSNTITNNSGSVCHSNINEMNISTKVAVPSSKMTSKAEHLTSGSTSTKTTSIFDSVDDDIVGIVPTSAFVKPHQLEQPSCVSHEDVTSLAAASSLNGQRTSSVNPNPQKRTRIRVGIKKRIGLNSGQSKPFYGRKLMTK
uniref:Uncharacterized protein n=1 Tax=Glossina pallidipes TaxID=7398 RepID=A0A1A9ZYW2_GLOPL